jgi:phosphopantothenoylcysteine decarboxylase/phosphopantothenate--cysteine ligase
VLLAELLPTPKIIVRLRAWFPKARLVGWKYEVEGDRDSALKAAAAQLTESRTDACIANGPAYGDGFGFVTPGAGVKHVAARESLYDLLEEWLRR